MTKMTDLHRFRKKPDCPGCEDQSKLKLRVEQLNQRFRKGEARLQAVQEALQDVNTQNAIVAMLADCDPAEIKVIFPTTSDGENDARPPVTEEHTIAFDAISGHKLKTLIMLLMESASLRLELELREALHRAEQ